MKKALFKDSIREIKYTYKRFISILLMAFLGVGFFAGIRAASPDMVDTIDTYYKNQNVYDIQVISTLGLTDDDVHALSNVENVEQVVATFENDGQISIDNKEIITRVMCIDNLNSPVLIEGHLPESKNECVVESSFLTENNKKIGDTIELNIEDSTNDEGESIPYLQETTLTIVGTIQSPIYISLDRGTSNLGAGKVDYYLYISKENVNANSIYTNIYIKVKDADKYTTSSDEYENYIDEVVSNIENIKSERENARHDTLINIANEKIADAEEELNTQRAEAQEELDKARKEIEDAKKQIEDGEKELQSNRETVDAEFTSAYNKLIDGKEELENSEAELADREAEANKQFEDLEAQKKELENQLEQTLQSISQIEPQYNEVIEKLNSPDLTEEEKVVLEQTKSQLESQLEPLNQAKTELENGISEIESGISSGKAEIENAKKQIEDAWQELEESEDTYYSNRSSAYAQLDSAEEELKSAKEELASGEKELEDSQKEFDEKITDAEKKLADSRQEVADIENPKWYILDRNGNSGYSSFIQDTESIANIGKVFPIIFFIVAALISLTSMTRMVEEERTQIGTLKALGYNKLQIISKYVIYASLACIVGSILGMCVGFVLLPNILWEMYSMMYQISDIQISFNFEIGSMGLIFISISIIGATIYSSIKELINTPATLMRPKAPKMGKRVLLEKIPFIWKHLKFSQKVTVRNIFRYKKRFLMTIIGIMGCTALIVTGFGIRDSITRIMPDQYEKIFNYDLQINLKSELTDEEKETYISELISKGEITKTVETYMTSGTAINGENREDVQIIVPKEKDHLDGLVNIYDINTKEMVEIPNDGICLTDKAAQLLNVEEGDTITLQNTDDKETQIKVSYIVENYVYHYIYMSKDLYESIYNTQYESNVILADCNFNSDENEDEFVTNLMKEPEVASVTRISTAMTMMDDTMQSLNYVVVILIVSAGLLAFVVLYNLSNVNISERIRELATIKVLGFYDKEVYLYITRETIILTIIGLIIGLGAGYFLDYFIMETCEIDMLRFVKIVEPLSYLYAALITIAFTIIVNIITYFALKKIDMIESLKSIE